MLTFEWSHSVVLHKTTSVSIFPTPVVQMHIKPLRWTMLLRLIDFSPNKTWAMKALACCCWENDIPPLFCYLVTKLVWSTVNTAGTLIIKLTQKRSKRFYRLYWMKCLWFDTDGRRNREKRVLEVVAHVETVWMGWDMVCHGVGGGVGGRNCGGKRRRERFQLITERSYLL